MFPEISREDIFRLETRRLWLRWPTLAEAAGDTTSPAEATAARAAMPEATSGDPYRDPVSRAAWRVGNASGTELHLLATGRGSDRRVIGGVDLVPVRGSSDACGLRLRAWFDTEVRGQGFGTEAVQAMVDAGFMLTGTPLVSASSRVLDPAFRRVLEKSGFGYCGTGLDPAADGAGLTASDRFRLDRKAWASLKGWRVPEVWRRTSSDVLQPCLS